MTYVLDTNIITAILKNNQDVIDKVQQVTLGGETVYINCISYYEVKRGLLDAKASSQITRFDFFCNRFGVLFLDSLDILEDASELYAYLKKDGNLIEDADILIASLTKVKNYTLVTNDTDFDRVQGLKVENWLS